MGAHTLLLNKLWARHNYYGKCLETHLLYKVSMNAVSRALIYNVCCYNVQGYASFCNNDLGANIFTVRDAVGNTLFKCKDLAKGLGYSNTGCNFETHRSRG